MKIISDMSSKTGNVKENISLVILMDVYQRSNVSSDYELLPAKMKFTVCLIQYKSSSILNKTLSRQYYPRKMRKFKNYLFFMEPCYIFQVTKIYLK